MLAVACLACPIGSDRRLDVLRVWVTAEEVTIQFSEEPLARYGVTDAVQGPPVPSSSPIGSTPVLSAALVGES